MLVTLLGMVIEVRPLHSSKAYFPILVTELGIAILVKPEHPENAPSLMDFTELGILISFRFLQSQNKRSSRLSKLVGSVMLVKPEHL